MFKQIVLCNVKKKTFFELELITNHQSSLFSSNSFFFRNYEGVNIDIAIKNIMIGHKKYKAFLRCPKVEWSSRRTISTKWLDLHQESSSISGNMLSMFSLILDTLVVIQPHPEWNNTSNFLPILGNLIDDVPPNRGEYDKPSKNWKLDLYSTLTLHSNRCFLARNISKSWCSRSQAPNPISHLPAYKLMVKTSKGPKFVLIIPAGCGINSCLRKKKEKP